MTAAKAAAPYRSGLCHSARHDRCRGAWGAAVCDCPCHTEPEPPPGPAARLTRAAIALDVDHRPVPAAAVTALARLLRSEGAHAAACGDFYPDDRAPLLELADLILGETA